MSATIFANVFPSFEFFPDVSTTQSFLQYIIFLSLNLSIDEFYWRPRSQCSLPCRQNEQRSATPRRGPHLRPRKSGARHFEALVEMNLGVLQWLVVRRRRRWCT